jgi:predicted metal-binding membrane protein
MTTHCCAVPAAGSSWFDAAMSFVGMWVLMMVPMMLPVLIPMLRRYRRGVGGQGLGLLTALAGSGYFFVWVVVGALLYPPAAALAALEAREPAVAGILPIAAGLVVVLAGLLQFSEWKARGVACCREAPESGTIPVGAGRALRHGMRLGLHCVRCCGNLMAVLLAVGMMDVRWMIAVTAAVTIERVRPSGVRWARAIGVAVIVWGVVLIARAAGLS